MRSIILSIALTLLASVCFGQSNVAPVNWQRYKIGSKDLTVLLPKLPIKSESQDNCRQQENLTYHAYADGAVYAVTVASHKGSLPRPLWCDVSKNKFDQESLNDRAEELASQFKLRSGTPTTVAGHNAYRFEKEYGTRLLISDFDAKRWIELEVRHYVDKKPDLDRFFESLEFDGAAGIDIGRGSDVTLGDEGVFSGPVPAPDKGAPPSAAQTPGNNGFTIVHKDRVGYTSSARRAGVRGSVTLRVTLLANGSIGNIAVVKELPMGLTEKAQDAARRIVFLPKRVDGKPTTTSVTVEYSFSIY